MNSERCSQCKHFIIANAGEGKIYGCDRSKCVFEPTTKNDLGVDLISRADLYNRIKGIDHDEDYECDEFGGSRITYHTCDWDEVLREIEDAPSVTPQPTKNDLEVDWESYKDADGNSLDYLILNVLQNNFDCGDAYGYTVADKIIGLLPSVAPLSSGLDKKLEKDFGDSDCISRQEAIDTIRQLYLDLASQKAVIDLLKVLPSVTPQLSSELDKNSKKLEKDFGELDCVSRADALALFCDKCGLYNCISKCSSYRAVEKMPSVTPQPRKGHWIKGYTFPDGEYWKCDKCNELIKVKYPMYYCNNCGSDNSREVEE